MSVCKEEELDESERGCWYESNLELEARGIGNVLLIPNVGRSTCLKDWTDNELVSDLIGGLDDGTLMKANL